MVFPEARRDGDGLERPHARVHAVDGGVSLEELEGGPVGGLVAITAFGGEGDGETAARHPGDCLRGKGLPVEDHGRVRGGDEGSSLRTSLAAQLYTGFVVLALLD